MKLLLTAFICTLTITCISQNNIYNALPPFNVVFDKKVGIDSFYNFFINQSHFDSLKNAYSIAVNANTTANNANAAATNAQTTGNGAVQVNSNQAIVLTTHTNQINGLTTQVATDGVNIAKAQSDIIALQQGGGGGSIPASITITSSQTIPTSLQYNADIWCNCQNGCTITIPIATKDMHWRIHNISNYTQGIKIAYASGLTRVNSVTSMGKGSRLLDISYMAANTVEVH